MQVYIYNWSFSDTDEDEEGLIIRAYGITEDRKNVYLEIQDFTPSCYLELPTTFKWDRHKIDTLLLKFKSWTRNKLHLPTKAEYCQKKKLYYANKENVLFPFIHISFKSIHALKTFCWWVKKDVDTEFGKVSFKLHEHDTQVSSTDYGVSPVLRLLSVRQIPSCGWVELKGKDWNIRDEDDKISNFNIEIETSYKALYPTNKINILIPKLGFFDLEANSSKPMSMPNSEIDADQIFQASIITIDNNVVKKYILSLGNLNQKIVGEDVKILKFNCEADLLVGITKFIVSEDIKVIAGYNILGWDLLYFKKRSEFRKVLQDTCKLGCLDEFKSSKFVEPEFKSKAYGAQKLTYFDAEGRLFVDLLPVIKRNYKLDNYRLSFVTTNFKLPTKDDVSPEQIFEAFRTYKLSLDDKTKEKEASEKLSIVAKYCVQDSNITYLLFKKLQMWYDLAELSRIGHVPLFFTFSQGTQIQMLSQVLEYCYLNNYVVLNNGYVTKEGDEYQGATVLEPKPGKYNKVLSFDFASLYPSIILAHNICYSTLVIEPKHHLVDKFDTGYQYWNEFPCFLKIDVYTKDDAMKIINEVHIFEKIINIEELKELIKDYREKYIEDIFIILKEEQKIKDEECNIFLFTEHVNCNHDCNRKKLKNGEYSKAKKKTFCATRYYRFMKESVVGKGVVPTLLSNHLGARKMTRKKISQNEELMRVLAKEMILNNDSRVEILKTEYPDIFTDIDKVTANKKKDTENNFDKIVELDELNKVFDKTQLAIKVNANSMYGAMGVKKGFLPLLPGAMCVTYKGRCSIEFISNYIPKRWNGESVYGDSVTGDTPIILKKNGKTNIFRIDEIVEHWVPYENFKKGENLRDKQQSMVNCKVWTYNKWSELIRVIRHKCNKKMYRVFTKNGCVDVTEDHSLITKDFKLIKPTDVFKDVELLTSFPNINKKNIIMDDYSNYGFEDKVECQKIYYIAKSLNYNVGVEYVDNKYYLNINNEDEDCRVLKIVEIPHEEDVFVYDLETSEGVFQAGIGNIVVKNTDSNHVFFPHIKNNEDATKLADEIIKEMGTLTHFFPQPMALDFEKVYEKYIILTKKRYIAKIANKYGKIIGITKRGCVLVRRDNCKALRNMFQTTVDMLLDDELEKLPRKQYNELILDKVVEMVNDIFQWKYSYKTYTVTKGLSKMDYKSKTIPAHAQLAFRMKERGVDINAGARIEFIYTTKNRGKKNITQGDKVEDIDYFSKWRTILRLDYLYYLEKQIVKPMDELLKVGLGIEGFMSKQYETRYNHYLMIQEIEGINMPDLIFDGIVYKQYVPRRENRDRREKEVKRKDGGCKYKLKGGKNKGSMCGGKIKENELCTKHLKVEKQIIKNNSNCVN